MNIKNKNKETLRDWYSDKSEEWFDKNLNSIVDIDEELILKGKDDNGFPFYTVGESNNRFYPTITSDVIVLDNGEEYILNGL